MSKPPPPNPPPPPPPPPPHLAKVSTLLPFTEGLIFNAASPESQLVVLPWGTFRFPHSKSIDVSSTYSRWPLCSLLPIRLFLLQMVYNRSCCIFHKVWRNPVYPPLLVSCPETAKFHAPPVRRMFLLSFKLTRVGINFFRVETFFPSGPSFLLPLSRDYSVPGLVCQSLHFLLAVVDVMPAHLSSRGTLA